MTNEEKALIFKDLCGRLPYKVLCYYYAIVPAVGDVCNVGELQTIQSDYCIINGHTCQYGDMKPYLRSMSSMTEEEKREYQDIEETCQASFYPSYCYTLIDWLNAHHFDYRGLIEKGLALEEPKDMYN